LRAAAVAAAVVALMSLSDSHDIADGHVEKLGLHVDELRNQPGTGNAVNFRAFTSDPLRHVTPSACSLDGLISGLDVTFVTS
jgi:hypothetical protein